MAGVGGVSSGSGMESTCGIGMESMGGAEGHDGEAKIITGWITCKGGAEGRIGNEQKWDGSDCEPKKEGSTERGSEVDCSASAPGATGEALVDVAVEVAVEVAVVAAVAAVAAEVAALAALAATVVAAVVAAATAAAAAAAVAAIELGSLKAL